MMKRLILFILVLLMATPAEAWELFGDDNPLPVKGTVRTRVNFWKKIYTEVTTQQGLIHDVDDLAIVYRKIDVPRSPRRRRRVVKAEKKKVKNLLYSIAKKNGENLTAEEKEIYKNIKGKSNKEIFALAKNLRCQYGLKDRYYEGLIRSYSYIDYIRTTFKKYGVPERLSYLPHVESSFNYHAYSKVGAAGIWQFMRSTGKLYKLKQNYIVDERRDPIKATVAAAKLLRDNYKILGKWPLALTAYNHGARSIARAIKQVGSDEIDEIIDNYDGRRFGFASKNFYATFMATVEISENPGLYFKSFKKPEAFKYSTIKLDREYNMKHLKSVLGLNTKTLRNFNPHIRRYAYKSHLFLPKGLEIRIPKTNPALVASYQTALKNIKITKKDLKLASTYRVQRGDSLFTISRMFKASVNDIIAFNRITNPRRIYPGMRLKIPGDKDVKKMAKLVQARKTKRRQKVAVIVEPKKPEIELDETVGSAFPVVSYASMDVENGDDLLSELYSIVELDEDEVANIMAEGEDLMLLPEKSRVSLASYFLDLDEVGKDIYRIKVEPEETFGHYADWAIIYIRNIQRLNNMGRRAGLRVGQSLLLNIPENKVADFQRKRAEYHLSIQEDFFSSYKVVGKKEYKVRRGDTLDRILRRNELPLWLLREQQGEKFNIAKSLFVGQKIYLPEIEQVGEGFSLMPTDGE
jgi:membrane-bound lytic murein transglycosylase D